MENFQKPKINETLNNSDFSQNLKNSKNVIEIQAPKQNILSGINEENYDLQYEEINKEIIAIDKSIKKNKRRYSKAGLRFFCS